MMNALDFVILAIFVDDLEFTSNSTRLMNYLKLDMSAAFDVKLFGELK